MGRNYGYLRGYSGNVNPKALLSEHTDPIVLQYYAVELNHAMKRKIYCIVSVPRTSCMPFVGVTA